MAKLYRSTSRGVMEWANSELAHIGRITSLEDPDIQYSYAMSTVNGMLHLRQALNELVKDPDYAMQKSDLIKTENAVVRALKHLIKDYDIDLNTIRNFNTRHVLRDFDFLKNKTKKSTALNNRRTRRN